MITLKVGKKYITRHSEVVMLEHAQIATQVYKFAAHTEWGYVFYKENGMFSDEESQFDIVAEYMDPDEACNTEDSVIALMRKRGKVGRQKYKCSMDRKDLHPDEWIEHHQQELCDALQYAQRMKGASMLLHKARDIMLTLLHERDWECAREWVDKYNAQFFPKENEPEKQ